ncbi:MAG: amino acid adenylation domain-containing protein, partial [Simkaniaceae bacterium]|nr:amino acid adenylation domain-containing protein [Simkaniaceae bacterium]
MLEKDKKKLLQLAKGPENPFPRDKNVVQVFEEIVKKYPSNIALQFSGNSLSYSELNERANQVARHLQKLGVNKHEFIGIYLERSIDLFVGILGILKAGAVYVPIDADYPMDRKRCMIEDTKLKILITSRLFENQFPKEKLHLLFMNELRIGGSSENLNIQVDPEDVAFINYTSGTTGKPKGVVITHLAINRLVINPNWITFSPDDRFLQISNISFDVLAHELWGSLLNGATLCIYPQITLSVDELGKFIVEEKITQIVFTSRLFTLMVEDTLESLKNVHYICSGGEVMSVKHAKIAAQKLPLCSVINVFGHTENTTYTTAYSISNTKDLKNEVPIGTPIRGTTAYILTENLELAPFGDSGELCVGGDGVAKGYLHQKELTAEKFIPNPYGKGVLYRTGDLVRYLQDGNISFLGRIDSQVKIRGFRIELSAIEETVRAYPHVSDCVAIVRTDTPEDKQLVVYIESGRKKIGAEDLRDWVSSKLPSYMVPTFFIFLSRLPMTPNGKIDKKALPPPFTKTSKKGFFQTETERLIGAIWARILHREAIDREDHFFKIGGDSIQAMQVISQIKKVIGCELSTATLFQHPNLSDLGSEIDALKQIKQEKIPERNKNVPLLLSLNQESIWMMDQLMPSKLLYMILYAYRGTGEIDAFKLQKSLEKIIERHEILRTCFIKKNELLVQHIEPKGKDFFLTFKAKNEKEATKLMQEKMMLGMDLTKLPLLQAILINISDSKFILGVRVHHIIFDILSYANFFKEWTSFYESKDLPKLPIQYGDYAMWQRDLIKKPEIQTQLSYWVKYLSDAPNLLELPWDKPRPPKFSGNGAAITALLPKQLEQDCKTLANQEGVTSNVFYLAAFKILLSFYSGKEDVIVGTPFANRTKHELDPLIGYFLQMFIIRSNCEGSLSFTKFLKNINEHMLNAYENSDVPLELIINKLNPERDPSFNPLFQVLFVFENISKTTIHFEKATLHTMPFEANISKVDITLFMVEREEELECRIEYCSDLFEKETIERMLHHFQTLLQSIVEKPNEKIERLSILTQ